MVKAVSGGLVHDMPNDLLDALIETSEIADLCPEKVSGLFLEK